MTDGQEREASVGLDESWEVVTSMAGGANVGPRFLFLARLCSDGCTMDGAPRSPEETEIEGTRGLTVEERDAYRRTRARLLKPFEPVSQSSTKTPGIGADI